MALLRRTYRKLRDATRLLITSRKVPISFPDRPTQFVFTSERDNWFWQGAPPKELRVDISGIKGPLALRPHSSDLYVFFEVLVKKAYDISLDLQPRLIIDAGANIGMAAIWFATRFPQARIISLEPEESNFEMLRKNTAAYPNIEIRRAALWHSKGTVRIADPKADHWTASVTDRGGAGDTVPAFSVADLLAETGEVVVDILKVDIEGGEREVFSRAFENWLPRVGVLLIETHDFMFEGCADVVRSAVATQKFEALQVGQNNVYINRELISPSLG